MNKAYEPPDLKNKIIILSLTYSIYNDRKNKHETSFRSVIHVIISPFFIYSWTGACFPSRRVCNPTVASQIEEEDVCIFLVDGQPFNSSIAYYKAEKVSIQTEIEL